MHLLSCRGRDTAALTTIEPPGHGLGKEQPPNVFAVAPGVTACASILDALQAGATGAETENHPPQRADEPEPSKRDHPKQQHTAPATRLLSLNGRDTDKRHTPNANANIIRARLNAITRARCPETRSLLFRSCRR
jgi:hypothetical protein